MEQKTNINRINKVKMDSLKGLMKITNSGENLLRTN